MSLNPGQQKAVDEKGHCLIVACPGSGKTHTLVRRAERLLSESPAARVAIVTFTRAAAEELRDRLVRKLGEGILPRVEAGTFHGLCLKQLEVLSTNGKRPFTIAGEGQTHILMMKAWEHVVRTFRVRIDRDAIKRGIEFSKANRGLVPPGADAEVIRAALDHYQQQLAAQKLLDFADIIEFTVQGMQGGQLPALRISDLLVDEFQDADAVQVDWVLAHVACGVRTTCVGDDDQAIYGFRHAKGYDGMMQFARRANATTVTLDTTYRCSSPVVAHAARLIGQNATRVAKSIQTANRSAGLVERQDYPSYDAEIEAAAHALHERPPGETAALLARTRNVLRDVETYMMVAGIPYKGGVEGSIWSGGVPGLYRGLIGAAVGKDPQGITMALSARGMTSAAVSSAREALQAGGGKFEALLGKDAWTKGLNDTQAALWDEIRGDYVGLVAASTQAPGEFVAACTRLIAPGVDGFSNPGILRTVVELLSKMKGSLQDIHRGIEQMIRKAEQEKDPEGGIALMTLHAAKGLEFDRVWMPAMRQGVLPHGNSDLAEERRLCYVGMTRARYRLTVSYSRTKDAPESVFLREMGLQLGDSRLKGR